MNEMKDVAYCGTPRSGQPRKCQCVTSIGEACFSVFCENVRERMRRRRRRRRRRQKVEEEENEVEEDE